MNDAQQEPSVPVWKLSRSAYQQRRGVHEPHIAEISPAQLGMMGRRRRQTYREERRREWADSERCAEDYAAEILAAHDRGELIGAEDGMHAEARAILRASLRERERQVEVRRLEEARRANRELGRAAVGDTVFDIMVSRYVTVVRTYPVSLRVRLPTGSPDLYTGAEREWTRNRGSLAWLHNDQLVAAAKAGITVDAAALAKVREQVAEEEP